MINIPITKILFIDIETVGGCPDYEACQKFNPELSEQFDKYFNTVFKNDFPKITFLMLKIL